MDDSIMRTRPRSASDGKLKEPPRSTGEQKSALASSGHSSLQDRVFSAILQQVIPAQEAAETTSKSTDRSKNALQKPNFSLPIMSNNFRRFNARIGVVFVFQNKMSHLFSWKYPSHTLSFLAVYTFCCLDPALIIVVPLIAILFFIMVPAFLARHPPPPNPQFLDTYAGQGPAIAPPINIKPAPDMSKAFFRNMRDLQNSMEDFSVVHDQLVNAVAPLTNFADERLSSTVFIGLFFLSCLLFVTTFVLPWRLVMLPAGWAAVSAAHPTVAEFIGTIDTNSIKRIMKQIQARTHQWILEDIALDEAPETREVEVFELQRQITPNQWEPWMYSTSAYDPQSPLRISGDKPRGTRFFEDVQPPRAWKWSDKKWTLDLLSQEWVEDRMITAVEVETDGERWVYDMNITQVDVGKKENASLVSEQESELSGGSELHFKGEWRRRRWVRIVKRKALNESSISKG